MRRLIYIIFITHFGIGLFVNWSVREGVNFHPYSYPWMCYPCVIGPLLWSPTFYHAYERLTAVRKGFEGAANPKLSPFPHTDVGYPLSDYFQRSRWKSNAQFSLSLMEIGCTLSGEKCPVDSAVPFLFHWVGEGVCYE